jgi:hypothetical protein
MRSTRTFNVAAAALSVFVLAMLVAIAKELPVAGRCGVPFFSLRGAVAGYCGIRAHRLLRGICSKKAATAAAAE